jgi:hypothetical protein
MHRVETPFYNGQDQFVAVGEMAVGRGMGNARAALPRGWRGPADRFR